MTNKAANSANSASIQPSPELTLSTISRDIGPGPPETQQRVSDGIRTRDRRDHNPELYQLSYAHQAVAAV